MCKVLIALCLAALALNAAQALKCYQCIQRWVGEETPKGCDGIDLDLSLSSADAIKNNGNDWYEIECPEGSLGCGIYGIYVRNLTDAKTAIRGCLTKDLADKSEFKQINENACLGIRGQNFNKLPIEGLIGLCLSKEDLSNRDVACHEAKPRGEEKVKTCPEDQTTFDQEKIDKVLIQLSESVPKFL